MKWNRQTALEGRGWDGEFSFADVYCAAFPQPDAALEIAEVLLNNNAVHLTRVTYPGALMVNVVVSTIPGGRSAEDEIARLVEIERNAERVYSHPYNISRFDTAFGPSIGLRIKDVAAAGRDAPFPLVRPILRPAKTPIESLSVHRLFVRGADRFEVAVYQLAPAAADNNTEVAMTERLTTLADATVASLQRCTAAMQPRK